MDDDAKSWVRTGEDGASQLDEAEDAERRQQLEIGMANFNKLANQQQTSSSNVGAGNVRRQFAEQIPEKGKDEDWPMPELESRFGSTRHNSLCDITSDQVYLHQLAVNAVNPMPSHQHPPPAAAAAAEPEPLKKALVQIKGRDARYSWKGEATVLDMLKNVYAQLRQQWTDEEAQMLEVTVMDPDFKKFVLVELDAKMEHKGNYKVELKEQQNGIDFVEHKMNKAKANPLENILDEAVRPDRCPSSISSIVSAASTATGRRSKAKKAADQKNGNKTEAATIPHQVNKQPTKTTKCAKKTHQQQQKARTKSTSSISIGDDVSGDDAEESSLESGDDEKDDEEEEKAFSDDSDENKMPKSEGEEEFEEGEELMEEEEKMEEELAKKMEKMKTGSKQKKQQTTKINLLALGKDAPRLGAIYNECNDSFTFSTSNGDASSQLLLKDKPEYDFLSRNSIVKRYSQLVDPPSVQRDRLLEIVDLEAIGAKFHALGIERTQQVSLLSGLNEQLNNFGQFFCPFAGDSSNGNGPENPPIQGLQQQQPFGLCRVVIRKVARLNLTSPRVLAKIHNQILEKQPKGSDIFNGTHLVASISYGMPLAAIFYAKEKLPPNFDMVAVRKAFMTTINGFQFQSAAEKDLMNLAHKYLKVRLFVDPLLLPVNSGKSFGGAAQSMQQQNHLKNEVMTVGLFDALQLFIDLPSKQIGQVDDSQNFSYFTRNAVPPLSASIEQQFGLPISCELVPLASLDFPAQSGKKKQPAINFPMAQPISEPMCLIESNFEIGDENMKNHLVKVRPRNYKPPPTFEKPPRKFGAKNVAAGVTKKDDKNEEEDDSGESLQLGRSQTMSPKTYLIRFKGLSVRIIDTCGIGDTGGPGQDKKNFYQIIRWISYLRELHAICILFKPNEVRLDIPFRYCVLELFTYLHKNAAKNVLFCFTNAQSTSFRSGSTFGLLEDLLREMCEAKNIRIPLNESTCFMMDNSPFRCLFAIKNGITFSELEMRNHRENWDQSRKNTLKLITRVCELPAHNTMETVTLSEARNIVNSLAECLSKITEQIQDNIIRIGEQEDRLKALMTSEEKLDDAQLVIDLHFVKAEPLAYPRTVCTAPGCTKLVETKDGKQIKIARRYCHEHCYLEGLMTEKFPCESMKWCMALYASKGAKCIICGCPWNTHKHERCEYKETMEKISLAQQHENRLEALNQGIDTARGLIAKLEGEQKKIFEFGGTVAPVLKRDALLPYSDAFQAYVELAINDRERIASSTEQPAERRFQMKKLDALKKSLASYHKKKELLENEANRNPSACANPQIIKQGMEELFNLELFGSSIKQLYETELQARKKNVTYNEQTYTANKVPRASINFRATADHFDKFCQQLVNQYYREQQQQNQAVQQQQATRNSFLYSSPINTIWKKFSGAWATLGGSGRDEERNGIGRQQCDDGGYDENSHILAEQYGSSASYNPANGQFHRNSCEPNLYNSNGQPRRNVSRNVGGDGNGHFGGNIPSTSSSSYSSNFHASAAGSHRVPTPSLSTEWTFKKHDDKGKRKY